MWNENCALKEELESLDKESLKKTALSRKRSDTDSKRTSVKGKT
jgi:hypothetical protein